MLGQTADLGNFSCGVCMCTKKILKNDEIFYVHKNYLFIQQIYGVHLIQMKILLKFLVQKFCDQN